MTTAAASRLATNVRTTFLIIAWVVMVASHISFPPGLLTGVVRGGPDDPGVVADDTLRCVHPMLPIQRIVPMSILRCDAGHRERFLATFLRIKFADHGRAMV